MSRQDAVCARQPWRKKTACSLQLIDCIRLAGDAAETRWTV